MKYLKRYESNDFDIKKEYLSDLLSDANLNGVSVKWHFSSDITVYIKSKIYSTNDTWKPKYECFGLSNYLEEILHFISYMYSDGYKLVDSSYAKSLDFRYEPYFYNLEIWPSKNINQILEHCRNFLDDYNICDIYLNFKPM